MAIPRYGRGDEIAAMVALRLATAQRKLAQTSKPILDIAAETGFRSPSAFSRAFHRRYGVSPRAIRKG